MGAETRNEHNDPGKFFPSFRPQGSLEFAKQLMEKALVAVSPGIGFGPLGEGHVRFALVENDHRIRQAARSIKQFLRGD